MRTNFILRRNFVLFLTTLALAPWSFAQANDDPTSQTQGRSYFSASCAECHGLDGRGTDKGADIAGNPSIQNLTDAQLTGIIFEGVVEEGMPAFRNLNENQLHALVGYLRTLQGKGEVGTLPGDPKRGREIFFGKGDCAQCHTVAGQGGFIGPDLTNHAMTSSASVMHDEIIRSPRIPAPRYRMAVVTTATGNRFEGVIRNEDNFSVQLQTTDGTFHLLQKAGLKSLEYSSGSLMPNDYRKRLSDSDLNDVISYLLTTPDRKNGAPQQKKWEEDEE